MNAGCIFERVEIMICLIPHLIDRTQKVMFLYLQQHIVVQHFKKKINSLANIQWALYEIMYGVLQGATTTTT